MNKGQLLYFKTMVRVWSRQLRAFGIHPYWLILVPPLIFWLITMLVWKTNFAGYLVFVAVVQMLLLQLSSERMALLGSCFSLRQQRTILAIEIAIWVVPIVGILLYHRAHIPALLILMASALWILFPSLRLNTIVAFPDWLQKRLARIQPFEFQTGFRQYFPALVLVLVGILLGVVVSNSYISIFVFGALGFTYLGMHSQVEPYFWVWISNQSAKEFLLSRMIRAITHVLYISGPYFVLVCILLPDFWIISTMLLLLHIYFAQIALLMKYSVFPSSMGVAAEIFLSLMVLFFPLGILYSPFLYRKSLKKLSWILP